MRRRWSSIFVEAALVLGAFAAPARAQVCCVGAGLVTPARLRTFEAHAVGLELHARAVTGAFGAAGDYAASRDDVADRTFEQALVAATRLGARFQLAARVPFVETSRRAGDLSGLGGGLGDVSLTARWDGLLVGERGAWPGLAVLSGATFPTGRSPDAATDPLAATATGQGAYEASVGVAVEQIFLRRVFVSTTAWVAARAERDVAVRQSLAPRLTVVMSGGYSFDGDVTVGGFALAMRQGPSRDGDGTLAGSALALVTAGVAGAFPVGETMRVQATISVDVPLPGWGRNQTTGVSSAATWLVTWM